MFKLLQTVTITHPLFSGCVGQVVDFAHEGGEILVKVDFLDREDKINKQVYFKQTEIKNRRLING